MSTKKHDSVDKILDEETLAILELKLSQIVEGYFNNSGLQVSDVKDYANQIKEKTAHSLHEAKQTTEQSIAENPFKTLGIALLAGAVVGWILKK